MSPVEGSYRPTITEVVRSGEVVAEIWRGAFYNISDESLYQFFDLPWEYYEPTAWEDQGTVRRGVAVRKPLRLCSASRRLQALQVHGYVLREREGLPSSLLLDSEGVPDLLPDIPGDLPYPEGAAPKVEA